jgi:ABC-type bacteriocin/lantibiotic exporter with double-glycine peptidase domain
MRFQGTPQSCSSASIVNALRCYGTKVREDLIAVHAGTTAKHGASEHGIKQALERLDYTWADILERKYATAEALLFSYLNKGIPVILLVEAGDHWVTAIGALGNKAVIFDSQVDAPNRRENGCHIYSAGEQLRRYWEPFESKRYGLAVVKA